MLSRRTFIHLSGLALLSSSCIPSVSKAADTPSLPDGCIKLTPPTRQRVLDGSLREGVFMDTGMGKPESGMFGNVRKYADGSPRFHEGIDIAPIQPWSRKKLPKDWVCAAAPGRVAHINRKASLYGNYVVLTHSVPGFGEIYTLYAHLAKVEPSLHIGDRVIDGMILGRMGNTPDIPVARAHLHFEIGVMMNSAYPLIDDDHGIWNGANLYGFNPCDAFKSADCFNVKQYLLQRKRAFSIVIKGMGERPEYFDRYPSLWYGKTYDPKTPTVVDFSYEGIPVGGENYFAPPDSGAPQSTVLSYVEAEVKRGRPYLKKGRLTKRGLALIDNLYVSARHPKGEILGEVGALRKDSHAHIIG